MLLSMTFAAGIRLKDEKLDDYIHFSFLKQVHFKLSHHTLDILAF
jgi:hypothetical protein